MIASRMGSFVIKRWVLLIAAGAALAGLVALLAPSSPQASSAGAAATKRVSVRDDFFSPRRAVVSVGDRVRWTWRDNGLHDVKFRSVPRRASKRSSKLQRRGRFSRSFTRRGTYRYVCTIHVAAGMRGTVVAR
jgi:plastocyanin